MAPQEQGAVTHRQRVRHRLWVVVAAGLVAGVVAGIAWLNLPASRDAEVAVARQGNWQYWRAAHEPPPAWSYSTDALGWPSGRAPLGYGSSGLSTVIDRLPDKPLSTYFRQVFTLDPGAGAEGAQFSTWADDGIIAYVNGHDIGRHRVADTGVAAFSSSYATEAVSTEVARLTPVTFSVPAEFLLPGRNVIAVQVIANSRDTRSISFDGQLSLGGGRALPASARPDANLTLAWSDEFEGTALNPDHWEAYNESTFGDAGRQTECLMNRPENLSVKGGTMVISARRESVPLKCGEGDRRFPRGRNYSSAHITSKGKVEVTYGRIEMRARIPVGQGTSAGLWPAFWMRPVDGGLGEIDIMEALGSGPGSDQAAGVVHQTVHRDYDGTDPEVFSYALPKGQTLDGEFHTYAVEWTPTEMRWYVDDNLTRSVNSRTLPWYNEAFVGRPFFIRLNMAVGGTWPGPASAHTQFPAEYVIDYVRVYQ